PPDFLLPTGILMLVFGFLGIVGFVMLLALSLVLGFAATIDYAICFVAHVPALVGPGTVLGHGCMTLAESGVWSLVAGVVLLFVGSPATYFGIEPTWQLCAVDSVKAPARILEKAQKLRDLGFEVYADCFGRDPFLVACEKGNTDIRFE